MQVRAAQRQQGRVAQCMQDLAVPCTQDPEAHDMQVQVVQETQDRVELPMRGRAGLVTQVLAVLAMPRMRQAGSAPQYASLWHRQCQSPTNEISPR